MIKLGLCMTSYVSEIFLVFTDTIFQ